MVVVTKINSNSRFKTFSIVKNNIEIYHLTNLYKNYVDLYFAMNSNSYLVKRWEAIQIFKTIRND